MRCDDVPAVRRLIDEFYDARMQAPAGARGMMGIVASSGLRIIGKPAAQKTDADAAAMLGALPVPVVLLDAENRFRFANHAAEQFLGAVAAADCPIWV